MKIRLELEFRIEPLSSDEIWEIVSSGSKEQPLVQKVKNSKDLTRRRASNSERPKDEKPLKDKPKKERLKSIPEEESLEPEQEEVASTASTGQRNRNLNSFLNLQCFSGSQFSRARAQSPGQLSSSSDLRGEKNEDKISHLRKAIEKLEIQVNALRTAQKNPTNAKVLRESKAELEDKRKRLKELEAKENFKNSVNKTESRAKISTAEDLQKAIEKLEIQIKALRTAQKNPTNARVLRETKTELEDKIKRLKQLESNDNLKKFTNKTESRAKTSTVEDLKKAVEKLEIQIKALRTAQKNPTNAKVLREAKADLEDKLKRLKQLESKAGTRIKDDQR